MRILADIVNKLHGSQHQFLLIGGFAAMNYIPNRSTIDIDLMTSKDHREFWEKLVKDFGYSLKFSAKGFSQFDCLNSDYWDLDLMFVENSTFSAMYAESVEFSIADTTVRIPSANHLLRMKLHSLKTRVGYKRAIDLADVQELLKYLGLKADDEEIAQLCTKYGSMGLLEELRKNGKQ